MDARPPRTKWKMWRTLIYSVVLTVGFGTTVTATHPTPPPQPDGGYVQELDVAVLAYRGTDHAMRRWASTMHYLSERIPGYQFRAVPMNLPQLDRAVIEGSVDFAITNAGQFVRVGTKHGMSGLATLKSPKRFGQAPAIGSALAVRADSPYKTLDDLRDARLGAVHPLAFGGFQIYWGEMALRGHRPDHFFADISFSGFPVDALTYWVRDRQVDAAVLPACLLEAMVKEGLVEAADFRVIDVRPVDEFDCRTSTPLYPNWSFATLRDTPQAITELVTHALLAVSPDSAAARDSGSLGWTAPMSSYDVHRLYETLDIHPWQKPWWLELWSWLAQNWYWGMGGALIVLLGLSHHLWVQYLVHKQTQDLRNANEKLMYQQQQLEHAQRVTILGELSSDLAHELNQPLTAINSFAEGCIVRLQRASEPPDFQAVLGQIKNEAQRGRQIIDRIRGFACKQAPRRERVDLTALIRETVALLDHELKKRQPDLTLSLSTGSLLTTVDVVEIQQLLVNLVRNSIDAMDGVSGSHYLNITARDIGQDQIELCVEDSGRGIGDQDPNVLFKAFHTTKPAGLGLGMSICRHIVEAHGGEISLIPLPQGGARVVCTLKGVADD